MPDDLTVVETLLREHLEFHDDLSARNKDVERLTKLPTMSKETRRSLHGSHGKLNESDTSARVYTLQGKWRNVWRISVDRKKRLQDAMDHLLELESFKNFDFDLWRQRYMNWIRAKKFRITDFFRRQDKDGDGYITRNEFVEGMLTSKFPTNRTELNAVFDIFDRVNRGLLDYREFVEALRPERRGPSKRNLTDSELITNEIEQQVSRCQCRQQFKATKIGEGKFKFGENQKLRLVRFLNSTVMVRVGGGWETLSEFLEQHDPCRAKGRTNIELREPYLTGEPTTRQMSFSTTPRRSGTPASLSGTPTSNGTPRSRGDGSRTPISPAGSVSSLHAGSSKRSTHSSGSSDTAPKTSTPKSRRSVAGGAPRATANGKTTPSSQKTPTRTRPRSKSPGTGRTTPQHTKKSSKVRGTPH